jgi:hypothetical protein
VGEPAATINKRGRIWFECPPTRGLRNRASVCRFEEDPSMKLIVTLLGVILIVVAVVYFVMPADSLPGFFPGHEAGVTRMHYKHGMVSGVAGVILLAVGWWMGRR